MPRATASVSPRSRVAVATLTLVATLLLAGCLGTVETTSLVDGTRLRLDVNETWTRTIEVAGENSFTLHYEVESEAADGALLVVCPPGTRSAREFDRDPETLRMFSSCPLIEGNGTEPVRNEAPLNPIAGDAEFSMKCHSASESPCAATVTLTLEEEILPQWWTRRNLFLMFVGAIVGLRLLADPLDRARIRAAVEKQGGRVIETSWRPFPRGWFFEKGERFYEVTFEHGDGTVEHTLFKTSLFTGVWGDEEHDR